MWEHDAYTPWAECCRIVEFGGAVCVALVLTSSNMNLVRCENTVRVFARRLLSIQPAHQPCLFGTDPSIALCVRPYRLAAKERYITLGHSD
jgi:hypothetical protein